MPDITLAQMLKYETVLGVFSRLKTAGSQMSAFYGLQVGSSGTERSTTGRTVGWDIFDNTRTMAKARAPYVGPARTRPKPTGHVLAGLVRLYESIDIVHEKVYGTRPLGAQYGAVDKTGQNYVGRQVKFGAQRMANSMEFMVSRMFRNGFSVNIDGEDHLLAELAGGTVDVGYQIPAGNLDQVAQDTADADVITASWTTVSTPIFQNLLTLNKVSERLSGYPITEFWVNSNTFGQMLDNTELQTVGGSAYRIFDTLTGTEISTTDGGSRPQGFTVVWRAMPMYNFHIYDAVLNVAGQVDSTAVGDITMYIPDNICIATPPPGMGEWYGLAIGGEPIMENDESEVEYKEGLHSWSKRMNDPPGEELRILHNVLPILYVPSAVFYMTVIF